MLSPIRSHFDRHILRLLVNKAIYHFVILHYCFQSTTNDNRTTTNVINVTYVKAQQMYAYGELHAT